MATTLWEKYNQVNMPNLRLGDAEVNALIHYLETRSDASAAKPNAAPTARTR